MNKQTQRQSTNVLGQDVNQALRELVRLNKKLIEFADQETQSLVTSDHMRFAFTQQDKESLARQYMQASEEFRTRLDDFRHADKSILMQLEKLQVELKEKTQNNNVLINQIKTRAAANTQSTLFTVQELGQRVSFPDNAAQKGTNKEERVAS
ncbi:MAG: hypothetical protein COB14_05845 [Alphaproteobacteria bacterium]|nr:MAG: hypothetical protein COB14_05845 [Alphaproteobacteria bacterium]